MQILKFNKFIKKIFYLKIEKEGTNYISNGFMIEDINYIQFVCRSNEN